MKADRSLCNGGLEHHMLSSKELTNRQKIEVWLHTKAARSERPTTAKSLLAVHCNTLHSRSFHSEAW